MLLDLFASLRSWGENVSAGRMKLLIGLLILISIACIAVPLGLGLEANAVAVLLGAGAGICWIVVANFIYWFLLSPHLQEKFNYREKLKLSTRRWVSGVFLLLWFAAILATNASLGSRIYVLLGALNVFVLVSLARFAVASDGERQRWSEMKEQELRDKLFTEAYEKGLIDENGNLTVLGEKLYGEEITEAEENLDKSRRKRSSRQPAVVEETFSEEETFLDDEPDMSDEAITKQDKAEESFNKLFGGEK